jgi:hypothetical protein
MSIPRPENGRRSHDERGDRADDCTVDGGDDLPRGVPLDLLRDLRGVEHDAFADEVGISSMVERHEARDVGWRGVAEHDHALQG